MEKEKQQKKSQLKKHPLFTFQGHSGSRANPGNTGHELDPE